MNLGFGETHTKKSALFNIGKRFSFILGMSVFLFIMYNMIFNREFIYQNLLVFAGILISVFIINFVWPRFLEKIGVYDFSAGQKEGMHLFGKTVNYVIVGIGTFIAYVLGVGFVFIISRIFRKEFVVICKSDKKSYWIRNKIKNDKNYFTNMF